MYCQNCGAHTSPEQNYCRTCGTGLRSSTMSTSGHSPEWPAPHHRWKMIVGVVTEALRSGVEILSSLPENGRQANGPTSRYKRWGLIAFWAGLAAMMGEFAGIILILVGIGLMAYERGFFRSSKDSASAHATEFQTPSYPGTTTSKPRMQPPVVTTKRRDQAPHRVELNIRRQKTSE